MKVLHMITIMISTVSTIGTYPMLDTNTIHKKRPSTLWGYRTKRVGTLIPIIER